MQFFTALIYRSKTTSKILAYTSEIQAVTVCPDNLENLAMLVNLVKTEVDQPVPTDYKVPKGSVASPDADCLVILVSKESSDFWDKKVRRNDKFNYLKNFRLKKDFLMDKLLLFATHNP